MYVQSDERFLVKKTKTFVDYSARSPMEKRTTGYQNYTSNRSNAFVNMPSQQTTFVALLA
jgi:hypothetical protein